MRHAFVNGRGVRDDHCVCGIRRRDVTYGRAASGLFSMQLYSDSRSEKRIWSTFKPGCTRKASK